MHYDENVGHDFFPLPLSPSLVRFVGLARPLVIGKQESISTRRYHCR